MTQTRTAATSAKNDDFHRLLTEIRALRGVRGVLAARPPPDRAWPPFGRALGRQPGAGGAAHESGVSFDDPSGDRLRDWVGLDRETFYDETRIAVMGMGFCYPGRAGNGGDLPPRRECAPLWHAPLRALLPAVELTLLVGSYAVNYYQPSTRKGSMTEAIGRWREFLPAVFVLPHPSWRTVLWLRANPWFENEVLPALRARVGEVLSPRSRSAPCRRR